MNIRLFFCAALALAPGFALAEENADTTLEPVIVTATRSEQDQNRIPAALIVITREDIERSGADHVAEVLRARAGVEVVDTFGDGSSALVGLRGFGENAHSNTLILVDGRRLNNPDIGTASLNSIALQDVERIEILQGSAGALYGDQAVGGVINIITRTPEAFAGSLDASGGSYKRGVLRGGAGNRLGGGWSYRLSGEGRRADNYRDHNGLDYGNLLGRADYEYGVGAAFLELQQVNERLQTPGALLAQEVATDRRQVYPDFRNDYSDNDTSVLRLGVQQPLSSVWKLESELTRRASDGEFRLSFRGAPATSSSTQDRRVLGFNPRLTGAFHNDYGTALLTLGVDAQRSNYRLLSSFGPQSNDQDTRDLYTQIVVPLPAALEASGGARLARAENDLRDGGAFAIAPNGLRLHDTVWAKSIGLAWRPVQMLRLFTRYDGNFRFPKVDEFFNAGGMPGAVALKTQTGHSLEAGTEVATGAWRATVLIYRLDLDDEIVFDPTTFVNVNLDSTRRNGALLATGLQVLDGVELSASYAVLDAEVRSGALKDKDIPLVAKHVGRMALNWAVRPAWNLYTEVQGNSPRAFSGDFENTLRKLPGYAVVNSAVQYHGGPWRIEARGNNLLGKEYSEFGSKTFSGTESFFPSPEQNFWITLGREF